MEGIEEKGGYCDLDDCCDTRGTLAAGFSQQLHDGRAHPSFACHRCYRAGSGPNSEAMIATMIYRFNCALSSIDVPFNCEFCDITLLNGNGKQNSNMHRR